MDGIKSWFAIIYVMAVLGEVMWSRQKNKSTHNWKDSLSNFAIVVVGKLIKPISLAWGYFLFTIAQGYQLVALPVNAYTAILTFIVVEFVYYWYHRISHEIPILWVVHHTHHSSPWFNFTTAGRLNWFGKFTSVIFYVPTVLLGFDPFLITFSIGISLIYQIFIHTEMIGRLGWFEGLLLNTPSAHRVHHASNEGYIDKNYGGVLIIWDRMFGTYVAEKEKAKFGVTTGFVGYNPLKIIFLPFVRLINGKKP